ncbi:MAG: flagellar export protein FliJ [Lachnospiraceae bacterium]|nr:flagellar export protein FliJ [Lachnospiraceae bacterium]
MAKFVYRMQNILDIKSKLEVQARNEYAQANAELQEEQEKLSGLVFKKRDCEDGLRREYDKVPLELLEIEFWKNNISYTEEQIKQQTMKVMSAQKKVEAKRDAMLELMRDRKTHELLRESAFEEFLQEIKAAESKEIDELVSYTYGKKQNESR